MSSEPTVYVVREIEMEKRRRLWNVLSLVVVRLGMTPLQVMDRLIQFMLRPRSNERMVRPTERVRWHYGLKQELLREQNGVCTYCGHHQPASRFEIDHMVPVFRGGSNDKDNLQAICRQCNLRKGIQTDEEFRARYARLVPQHPLTPPRWHIPQEAFKVETLHTSLSNTVKKFRKSRFYTKREKIAKDCSIVYLATAYAVLLLLYYLGLEGLPLGLPSIMFGGTLSFGIWLRAYKTGAMIEEEQQ